MVITKLTYRWMAVKSVEKYVEVGEGDVVYVRKKYDKWECILSV